MSAPDVDKVDPTVPESLEARGYGVGMKGYNRETWGECAACLSAMALPGPLP